MAESLFDPAAARLRAGDLAGARTLFEQAGEAGDVKAAVIFANFVAAGVGAPSDWPRGVELLRALARVNPRSARELAVVEAMHLTPEGDPVEIPVGEIVSEQPHIVRFPGLFSPGECRYLASAALPMLAPAVVVDPASGRQVRDPVRISDSVGFTWPLENPAVHALNRRLAAASRTAPEQGEPLQVLRYRPGGEYKPHFDAIPGFDNQRVLTMLVWLNDGYEGGETWFPAPKLALKGRAGDAILFRNADEAGERDDSSAHAGLPVKTGEKLIASRWIRARRFEMPLAGVAR